MTMLDQNDLQLIEGIVTRAISGSEKRLDGKLLSLENRIDGKTSSMEDRIILGISSLIDEQILPQLDQLHHEMNGVKDDIFVLRTDVNAKFTVLCHTLERKGVFTSADTHTVRET